MHTVSTHARACMPVCTSVHPCGMDYKEQTLHVRTCAKSLLCKSLHGSHEGTVNNAYMCGGAYSAWHVEVFTLAFLIAFRVTMQLY